MISKPTVSIVCTNFNKGAWIKNALDSFLDQKAKFAFEIIVIDDASTDNSPNIIKKYASKYPDRIRALYNKKNVGITKTWIKACKYARGKYIARCDGDDFWVDSQKLQKQVDALEVARDSRWSSTDFNVVLPDGTVTSVSVFEKGSMKRPKSYEEFLATKGFTMSSSWLVDTKLMLSVNESIDEGAVDDTFSIQIELFHRTKLKYLPYATVAYRVGYESDSKPTDLQKIKLRYSNLLKTQLEYIDKYRDVDYIEMLKYAIKANTRIEAILADKENEISIKNQTIDQQQTYITDQGKTITDQGKTITDQGKTITDIVNSRRYKLASKLARPALLAKLAKDRTKR